MPGWFSSADPCRLGQAIVKAQQYGVDAALIRKAESALEKAKASYLPRSPSVSTGALRGPWPRLLPQPRLLPPRLTYAANSFCSARASFTPPPHHRPPSLRRSSTHDHPEPSASHLHRSPSISPYLAPCLALDLAPYLPRPPVHLGRGKSPSDLVHHTPHAAAILFATFQRRS